MGVAEVYIGRREGEPGKAVQAGKRGKRLIKFCPAIVTLKKLWEGGEGPFSHSKLSMAGRMVATCMLRSNIIVKWPIDAG